MGRGDSSPDNLSGIWGTYRSGIGTVQGSITHNAIAHQPFPREKGAGADRRDQGLRSLGKDPLHSHVAQHWGHGLLQGFDHLLERVRQNTEQTDV